jgi:fanconi-associated nuclease 1
MKEIFTKCWKWWCQAVQVADEHSRIQRDSPQNQDESELKEKLSYWRKRFHPGHVLTRIVYQAESQLISPLGQYPYSVKLLRALLAQKHFRRGKRGGWYDRLALVLMNHSPGQDPSEEEKRKWRTEALKVCREGVEDGWTHLSEFSSLIMSGYAEAIDFYLQVYRHALLRRVCRLESLLGLRPSIPALPKLKTPNERIMKGERIIEESVSGNENGSQEEEKRVMTGKTVWRLSDGGEGSVEELALEGYKREGWKGFHSENGILTTIVMLIHFCCDAKFDQLFTVFFAVYRYHISSDPICIRDALPSSASRHGDRRIQHL